MDRIHPISIVLLGLAFLQGCRHPGTTRLVLVNDRKAFQDPVADIRAMARRLEGAGATEVESSRSGDSVVFEFLAPPNAPASWSRILLAPGIIATSEIVLPGQVPRFVSLLRLRFGREVDLRPDLPGSDALFASVALVPLERKAEVAPYLETIEFLSALEDRAKPVWGRVPGSFDRDGSHRVGAELFLLPPVPRGGWMGNEVFDSAAFVPGADSTRSGVELHLTRQGRAAYMEMTQEMLGAWVAILVDGELYEVAKVVQPVSSDRFWIGGCGTECRELAAILHGGPVRGGWRMAGS